MILMVFLNCGLLDSCGFFLPADNGFPVLFVHSNSKILRCNMETIAQLNNWYKSGWQVFRFSSCSEPYNHGKNRMFLSHNNWTLCSITAKITPTAACPKCCSDGFFHLPVSLDRNRRKLLDFSGSYSKRNSTTYL